MANLFAEKIQVKVEFLKESKLTAEDRAVMSILYGAYKAGNAKVSQRLIATTERWLGCSSKYELDKVGNPKETTLRKVRQIIHDLRVVHGAPILSDRNGYWIPKSQQDVDWYLARLEQEWKAQAQYWFETYRSMERTFEVKSKYFEDQKTLF